MAQHLSVSILTHTHTLEATFCLRNHTWMCVELLHAQPQLTRPGPAQPVMRHSERARMACTCLLVSQANPSQSCQIIIALSRNLPIFIRPVQCNPVCRWLYTAYFRSVKLCSVDMLQRRNSIRSSIVICTALTHVSCARTLCATSSDVLDLMTRSRHGDVVPNLTSRMLVWEYPRHAHSRAFKHIGCAWLVLIVVNPIPSTTLPSLIQTLTCLANGLGTVHHIEPLA